MSEWISVKKRKPGSLQEVIMLIGGVSFVGFWDGDFFGTADDMTAYHEGEEATITRQIDVTHWMPLPEPLEQDES